MKKYVLGLIVVMAFAACNKHDEDKDGGCIKPYTAFFKDANLSIGSIRATQNAGTTTVNYNTIYEKNITKLELMSGETANTLCTINTQNLSGNSLQTKNYSVVNSSTTNTVYYMFRYTLVNGEWGYTGLYKPE